MLPKFISSLINSGMTSVAKFLSEFLNFFIILPANFNFQVTTTDLVLTNLNVNIAEINKTITLFQVELGEIGELRLDFYSNLVLKKVKLILKSSENSSFCQEIIDDFVLKLDNSLNPNFNESTNTTFSDLAQVITYLGIFLIMQSVPFHLKSKIW
jgi:hypothetical protein